MNLLSVLLALLPILVVLVLLVWRRTAANLTGLIAPVDNGSWLPRGKRRQPKDW
jgi:hypothetical protein